MKPDCKQQISSHIFLLLRQMVWCCMAGNRSETQKSWSLVVLEMIICVTPTNKIRVQMNIYVLLAWRVSSSNNQPYRLQSSTVYIMLLVLLSYVHVIIIVLPAQCKIQVPRPPFTLRRQHNMYHRVKGNFFREITSPALILFSLRYLCVAGFHMQEVEHQKPNQEHSNIWIWTHPFLVHSNALW